MVDRAELHEAPGSGGLVLRRVIARTIDDSLLTLLSILIALAINKLLPAEFNEDGLLSAGGSPPEQTLAILLTGLISTILFLLYVGTAAGRGGATLGRVTAGIRVAGPGGASLPGTVIFGRELARVALVCLSLALVNPVAGLLSSSVLTLAGDQELAAVGLIATTIATLVPIGIVVAGWIGAALLDPEGRAPHDRLARSTVVRAASAQPLDD